MTLYSFKTTARYAIESPPGEPVKVLLSAGRIAITLELPRCLAAGIAECLSEATAGTPPTPPSLAAASAVRERGW